jgi:hypothetical protein
VLSWLYAWKVTLFADAVYAARFVAEVPSVTGCDKANRPKRFIEPLACKHVAIDLPIAQTGITAAPRTGDMFNVRRHGVLIISCLHA